MEATINKDESRDNVAGNRKEDKFYYQYTVINREAAAIIQLRYYHTSARNYACVWVHDAARDTYISGGGYAGGYGYHRPSAAAEAAFNAAGITLSEAIGGVGDSAVENALGAIMRALGHLKFTILTAHA